MSRKLTLQEINQINLNNRIIKGRLQLQQQRIILNSPTAVSDGSGQGGEAELDAPATITVTQIDSVSQTWEWDAVVDATNYILQIDTASDFSSPTQVYSGSNLSAQATGLIPDTKYYARVKAQASGFSDSSWTSGNEWTFVSQFQKKIDREIAIAATQASISDQKLMNSLIKYFVNEGIFAELDGWKFNDQGSVEASRVDVIFATDATDNGSITWAQDGGISSLLSGYRDHNWNPATHRIKYQQSNASLIIYVNIVVSGDNKFIAGAASASSVGRTAINPRTAAGNCRANCNGANSQINLAVNTSAAVYHVLRTASNRFALYKNGVLIGTSAGTQQTLTAFDFFELASNEAGTAASFTTEQSRMIMWGSNLESQAANITSAINAYVAKNTSFFDSLFESQSPLFISNEDGTEGGAGTQGDPINVTGLNSITLANANERYFKGGETF